MAFYCVLKHDTREDTIHVYKATDPTGTWTAQDTYVFDGPILSIWAFVASSDIHIAVAGTRRRNQDDFGFVKYLRYDVGTDAIDIDEEQVDDNDVFTGLDAVRGSLLVNCSVVVRSDGDVVVNYCALQGTQPTVNYSRRETGSWTRGIQVPSGTTDDYTGCIAELGASDRTHFFFTDRSNDAVRHRSLSSGNALGSTDSSVDTVLEQNVPFITINALAFNDGTARVRVIYEDNLGQVSSAYGNDQENPSWTVEADASDVAVAGAQDQSSTVAIALDGQVTHLIYADTANDIWIDENDGIGGWGTDTEEQDAVSCQRISANVYDRSGQKLAYLWTDITTTHYDEVDLAGVVTTPVKSTVVMQAVTRAHSW